MKEKYEVIVSGNYTTEKVIAFIAQQNAYLLALCGREIPIPPEIRQEVMEFVRYFDETCSDKIQRAVCVYVQSIEKVKLKYLELEQAVENGNQLQEKK
ncbi:MAG: hypothetical protein ACI4EO_07495 [Blautia sp.]